MTLLSPAETCRSVADIIDFDAVRFNIRTWERSDSVCGTTACIAGHTALLHSDGKEHHRGNVSEDVDIHGEKQENFWPDSEWIVRQGQRLGLTEKAADVMFDPSCHFWERHNAKRRDHRYSKVLRQLEKELENREDDSSLIDLEELKQIAVEAFR